QPRAVITDVATLDTLPERELRAGLAEVIKHALALDLRFVEWLEKSIDSLLARERSALVYAVRRCCELKAGVVAADERESGPRRLSCSSGCSSRALAAEPGRPAGHRACAQHRAPARADGAGQEGRARPYALRVAGGDRPGRAARRSRGAPGTRSHCRCSAINVYSKARSRS